MENKELEKKLTPAAMDALNELVQDYKNQILIGAKESATNIEGEVPEISVHDIFNGVTRTQAPRLSGLLSKYSTILRLYIFLGAAIGFIGLSIFVYKNITPDLDFGQQLPLLIGFSGIMVSLISLVLIKWKSFDQATQKAVLGKSISYDVSEHSMLFVKKWQEMELLLRNNASLVLGESKANLPLSAIVDNLRQENILSENDKALLLEFISIRNKIVHEGFRIGTEQLQSSIKDANRLIEKIEI